ncbi:MAG: hypothetical protein ISS25_00175 [Nanoarchaeota archaeon]|nr:hypothetical protein [DPANN group archaeon]MBL7116235.1 hypothetical protein [Nanoarchaeota archaeon]
MFKGKEVQVALIGDAKKTYLFLKKEVKEELEIRKIGTENQTILKSIEKTIEKLKENPQYGTHIKKKQIPKYYIEKLDVRNLWKCDLANFWRLIYWIDGLNQVKIISFVVDIMNHKQYNKIFGYKKS